MSFYEAFLRPLLFRLDPEKAHNLALKAVSQGYFSGKPLSTPHLEKTLFGVKFPNPVGLAAGFDKNGVALNQWKNLGFGFVEVGTITRHAQPGNDKPRMFRIREEKGLINRLGFNNEGADAAAARIGASDPGIPLGINLGKSKITELEDAADDYAYSFEKLKSFGDYFVVNVSSPNTPGLRTLQDKPALTKIFWRLREIDGTKPLFVKIAPDLNESQFDDVIEVAKDMGLTGIIATNTTISRPLATDPKIEGGLSGLPVRELADKALEYIHKQAGDDLVLIGVGGVMGAADARRKMELGASLVQVYTGWVYGGPHFVRDLVQELNQQPALL